MAFPASGTISFNNARTEMGQSAMTDYSFRRWASGAGCDNDTTSGQRYAPINVHSSNSGKYSTSCTNYQMSTSGLTVTINYNYTYNSSVGQYLYVVVYTTCT
jgi:hypothetical protein